MTDTDEIERLRALWCEEKSKSMTFHAEIERLRAEVAALKAERDKLVEDNASQTYKGNSVCYWHDKANAYKATIGSLWEILESAAVRPDGERTITAALTALVAERDELKQLHAHLGQSYTMLAKECDALRKGATDGK